MWEFDDDITFCMDECDNMKCFRNKNIPRVNRINSFAYLRNTPYCPSYDEENKVEDIEKSS